MCINVNMFFLKKQNKKPNMKSASERRALGFN